MSTRIIPVSAITARCPAFSHEGQIVRHIAAVSNQTGTTATTYSTRRTAARLFGPLRTPAIWKIQFAFKSNGMAKATRAPIIASDMTRMLAPQRSMLSSRPE